MIIVTKKANVIKKINLEIPLSLLTKREIYRIKDKLNPLNPKYLNALKMGFQTFGIQKRIKLYLEYINKICIPREFDICSLLNRKIKYIDRTKDGKCVNFQDNIILDEEQNKIFHRILKQKNGIIKADCGRGKTVVLLKCISIISRKTLILVHSLILLEQWIEMINKFLNIEIEDIGIIGGGEKKYGEKITIGLVQTVHKGKLDYEFTNSLGIVVCDEVHKFSAPIFIKSMMLFPAKIRLGATATDKRNDGLDYIFRWNIGDVFEIQDNSEMPKIFIVDVPTEIEDWNKLTNYRGNDINISKMITEISNNKNREEILIKIILKLFSKNRKLLVLCDRVKQANRIYEKIKEYFPSTGIITGKSKKDRKLELKKDIIVATNQVLKEGVNKPSLDTLLDIGVYGDPIRAIQSAGRVKRKFPDKKEPWIICFRDYKISICTALIRKRIKQYNRKGYKILEKTNICK